MHAFTPCSFIDCFLSKMSDDQLPSMSSIHRSIQLIILFGCWKMTRNGIENGIWKLLCQFQFDLFCPRDWDSIDFPVFGVRNVFWHGCLIVLWKTYWGFLFVCYLAGWNCSRLPIILLLIAILSVEAQQWGLCSPFLAFVRC